MAVGILCGISGQTDKRVYSAHLNEKNIDHEESVFEQFIMKNVDMVCPPDGVSRYENKLTTCIVHEESSENEQDEGQKEEVRWLWVMLL